MAVISNKTTEFVQPLLDGLEIVSYFRIPRRGFRPAAQASAGRSAEDHAELKAPKTVR